MFSSVLHTLWSQVHSDALPVTVNWQQKELVLMEKAPTHRLPGITCSVCERFLKRFGDEAKDIRTGRPADAMTISKLVFRTYHQHQRDEWAGRCLDLIDRMCLEGIDHVKRGLDEFER